MENSFPTERHVFANVAKGGQLGALFGLFFGFMMAGQVAGAIAAIAVTGRTGISEILFEKNFENPDTVKALVVMQIVGAVVTFLIPAYLFSRFSAGRGWISFLKANRKPALLSLLIAGLIMICGLPLVNFLGELNTKIPMPQWAIQMEEQGEKLIRAFLGDMDLGKLFINLFMIAFLAALGEEFFFRGCMQRFFAEWTKSTHAAVWITAALFSLLHAQFFGFIPRMVLGAGLGYMFVWSGSIWVPVFAHFVNNATAVILEYLAQQSPQPGEIRSIDKAGSAEGEWMYVAASVTLTALMILALRGWEKLRSAAPWAKNLRV